MTIYKGMYENSAPFHQCFILMLAGNVDIILPYNPTFYVRTGEDFNITCVSNNVKLLWYRNTKKYGKVDIYVKNGGKFEMVWTEYHPSWKVQSILIRKDAELSDTGTYTCHDHRNMSTYSTKVTVLHSKYLSSLLS